MTISAKEFAEKVIGKPWKNRATGPNAYDCWGLVIASFREIDGIELPQINGYLDEMCDTDTAAGQAMFQYDESTGKDGDIVCMYNVNGEFVHVGRMFFGMVLHAAGSEQLGTGQVKLDRLEVMKRAFKKVEFRKYASSSVI